MACSSRISRIVPIGYPLTWDIPPAEYQPLSPPSAPFTNSKPVSTEYVHRSLSPGRMKGPRSAKSPLSTISSISPPTRPFKFLLLKGPRSDAGRPGRNHEGNMHKDSLGFSNSRRHTPGNVAIEKQKTSPSASSRAYRSEYDQREHALPRIRSSPGSSLPAASDETAWTTAASSIHNQNSREDKPLSGQKATFTKTHRHKYSHVVQTDALRPNPSWNAHPNCKSSQAQTSQQQAWVTEDNKIDWETYFSNKPLPASAAWSRPEATVYDVNGQWTGGARIISP